MKFTLDSAALEGFNREGIIEVSGLYTADQILAINREIDQFLAAKGVKTQEEAMGRGRDLFRSNELFKKQLALPSLGQIAYELVATKPLRLAYDQLLVGSMSLADNYAKTLFLHKNAHLQERSCISELVLGAMLALKASEAQLPFAGVAGHIVFFRPDRPIPFSWLKEIEQARYVLLAFATVHAQYIFNADDPQNHYLKQMGYIYGDKLKDNLHPIFYR